MILNEMANIRPNISGVDGVVMWFIPNDTQHGMRIKVSNVLNKVDKNNFFTITIPKFEIIGDVKNRKILKKLDIIKKFIVLNIELIQNAYIDENFNCNDFERDLQSIKTTNNDLFEYVNYNTSKLCKISDIILMNDEKEFWSSFTEKSTNIKDVVLWFEWGNEKLTKSEVNIKVLNKNDGTKSGNNVFSVYVEDLSIVGDPSKIINGNIETKISEILLFTIENREIIYKYYISEIFTDQFGEMLKPYKER